VDEIISFLCFRRRRKQQKLVQEIGKTNVSSRYLDASGTSSRAQLVTPLPPPNGNGVIHDTHSSRPRANISQSTHYPLSSSSFAQNAERYHRDSRSDFDVHHNSSGGIDYRHHASIPYRVRPTTSNGNFRGYSTIDHTSYNPDASYRRRAIPKSFSDCDLCKRRVIDEEHKQYYNEHDDNWQLGNTIERRAEPRAYRDKIKERVRERLTVRQIPDTDVLPTSTVEYSTVLPRHQRIASESNRSDGPVHHLPFEYIPNENPNHIRTVEFKRNPSQERLSMGNNQQHLSTDENGSTKKFYERNDDDTINRLDRRLHEPREIQEMSMRMNEQQNMNRQQYYHQQRHFNENTSEI
jgi:hypothetical protein